MEVRGHQKVCRSLEFSTLYIIVSRFSEIRGQLVLQMLTNQQTVLKRTPSLESQYYSTPLVVTFLSNLNLLSTIFSRFTS